MLLTIAAGLVWFFWFNQEPTTSNTVEEKNKKNAAIIESEKNANPTIITEENQPPVSDSHKNEDTNQPTEPLGPPATVDQYGPSTKLDRPNVHSAVLATYSIYSEFLYKLQQTNVENRQAVADQYVAANNSYFGANYNYLSNGSLHLFPQASSLALPDTIRIYSAIVDPEDPTRVIVQVFMEPDTSWSLLLVVSTDHIGGFKSFEKLMPRMNRNPL